MDTQLLQMTRVNYKVLLCVLTNGYVYVLRDDTDYDVDSDIESMIGGKWVKPKKIHEGVIPSNQLSDEIDLPDYIGSIFEMPSGFTIEQSPEKEPIDLNLSHVYKCDLSIVYTKSNVYDMPEEYDSNIVLRNLEMVL